MQAELESLEDDPTHPATCTEYEDKYYAAYGKAMTLERIVSNYRFESTHSLDVFAK